MEFDPSAPAPAGSGPFGLSVVPDQAGVVLVPVPFEATTSYRGGTADGPRAIVHASHQVDLFDVETGRPYEAGIAMLAEGEEVWQWNEEAAVRVRGMRRARDAGETDGPLHGDLRAVDGLCDRLNRHLRETVERLLDGDKLVGTIGGDHGAVFGAIQAHAERFPGLGILHVDAHHDLRHAYEGLTWSHASIMDNVLRELPGVQRLVQVGIRDLSEEERDAVLASAGRVRAWYDADLQRERFEGTSWGDQVARMIADLPEQVYVSFDVDGLDPRLCPHTGTPVPGGLDFAEATYLLGAVARSGRRIVGFDLSEVAPGPEGDEWDAIVGARLLYKLIGFALLSRR